MTLIHVLMYYMVIYTQHAHSPYTFMNTKHKTFTFIYDYDIVPHYGNPKYDEDEYEFDVIRSHVDNKLQVGQYVKMIY